jgi:RpiB/LacA/LacB family sugar-phosphate isomerase
MLIAVASDHAGRALQDEISAAVTRAGHQPLVLTVLPIDPDDDYPDVALLVGATLLEGRAERGIVICGSGAGVAVAASKLGGIRAALAHDTYTAHQMVEHDDVNVLALGARVVGPALADEVVAAFVGATFTGEERHRRRLAKLAGLERIGAEVPVGGDVGRRAPADETGGT